MSNPSNPTNRCKALCILDEEFLSVRAKLIDIAAVLDRIDRASNATDVAADKRMKQIRQALEQLLEPEEGRAERIQMLFSLPYNEKRQNM